VSLNEIVTFQSVFKCQHDDWMLIIILQPIHSTISSLPNKGYFADFTHIWLPWQCPLKNRKKGPDWSSTNKYLSFGENIIKISPVYLEIIGLRAIAKKRKKKEINTNKIYSPSGKFAERAKIYFYKCCLDYNVQLSIFEWCLRYLFCLV